MTNLTGPVSRTVVTSDGRELVVTLTQAGLTVREKGKRTEYGPLGYGWLWLKGAELTAAQNRPGGPKRRVSRNVLAF